MAQLDARHSQAWTKLRAGGLENEARQFEEALKQRGMAVVNTYPGFAKRLGKIEDMEYLNYYERRQQGIDEPPSAQVSTNRTMCDGFAYPDYGDRLRFAALALNPRGLPNYGSVSLILKTSLLEARASLLERNSYHFTSQHVSKTPPGTTFPFGVAPPGYRSDWNSRDRLALAKHVDDLAPGMKGDQFDAVVLSPGGTRGEDRFIEIGIYNPFGLEEIVEIHAPRTVLSTSEDQDVLEDAADAMRDRNVGWTWYDP